MNNLQITIQPSMLFYKGPDHLAITILYKKFIITTMHQLQKYQCKTPFILNNNQVVLNHSVTFNISKQFQLKNTMILINFIGRKEKQFSLIGEVELDLSQYIQDHSEALECSKCYDLKLKRCQDNSALFSFKISSKQEEVCLIKRKQKSLLENACIETESYLKESLLLSRRNQIEIPTAYEISHKNYKHVELISSKEQPKSSKDKRYGNSKVSYQSEAMSRSNSKKMGRNYKDIAKTDRFQRQEDQGNNNSRPNNKQNTILGLKNQEDFNKKHIFNNSHVKNNYFTKKSPSPRMKTPEPISSDYRLHKDIPSQLHKDMPSQLHKDIPSRNANCSKLSKEKDIDKSYKNANYKAKKQTQIYSSNIQQSNAYKFPANNSNNYKKTQPENRFDEDEDQQQPQTFRLSYPNNCGQNNEENNKNKHNQQVSLSNITGLRDMKSNKYKMVTEKLEMIGNKIKEKHQFSTNNKDKSQDESRERRQNEKNDQSEEHSLFSDERSHTHHRDSNYSATFNSQSAQNNQFSAEQASTINKKNPDDEYSQENQFLEQSEEEASLHSCKQSDQSQLSTFKSKLNTFKINQDESDVSNTSAYNLYPQKTNFQPQSIHQIKQIVSNVAEKVEELRFQRNNVQKQKNTVTVSVEVQTENHSFHQNHQQKQRNTKIKQEQLTSSYANKYNLMQKQISSLELQNKQLSSENERYRQNIYQLKRQLKDHEQEIKQNQSLIEKLSHQYDCKLEQLEALRQQIQSKEKEYFLKREELESEKSKMQYKFKEMEEKIKNGAKNEDTSLKVNEALSSKMKEIPSQMKNNEMLNNDKKAMISDAIVNKNSNAGENKDLSKTSTISYKEQYLLEKRKTVELDTQVKMKENQIKFLKLKMDNLTNDKHNLTQEIDMIARNNQTEISRKGSISKLNLQSQSVTTSLKLENHVLKEEILILHKKISNLNAIFEKVIHSEEISEGSLNKSKDYENLMIEKLKIMQQKCDAMEDEVRKTKNKFGELLNAIWKSNNSDLMDETDLILQSQE